MGSTLSTINILSAMAKKKLASEPEKANDYIGKITDNSQRMMEVMDDIVWSIKPSNDSMQKIAGRMREFATNVLEAKDIELEFLVDEKVNGVKLNMAARRDLFLIFKEAINNIAKYSQAKNASVQLGLHSSRLVMMIRDNGVGFDVEKTEEGNGLGNMQKRADLLKARLQIQSTPSVGTRVILNMHV
jgi:signal transduction histidine kinase